MRIFPREEKLGSGWHTYPRIVGVYFLRVSGRVEGGGNVATYHYYTSRGSIDQGTRGMRARVAGVVGLPLNLEIWNTGTELLAGVVTRKPSGNFQTSDPGGVQLCKCSKAGLDVHSPVSPKSCCFVLLVKEKRRKVKVAKDVIITVMKYDRMGKNGLRIEFALGQGSTRRSLLAGAGGSSGDGA